MSAESEKDKRAARAEFRSRFAEMGYYFLAAISDILFKGFALSVIAGVILPAMDLKQPPFWVWPVGVMAWQVYNAAGNFFTNRFVRYAKQEHRHHSPEPEMPEAVAMRVIMSPSPITNPKPTVPVPPDPKPED